MLLSSNRPCNRLSLFVGLIGCLQMLARFAAHTDGGKNDDHREAAASNGQRQNERVRGTVNNLAQIPAGDRQPSA